MSVDQLFFSILAGALVLLLGACQIKDWWDGDGGGFA